MDAASAGGCKWPADRKSGGWLRRLYPGKPAHQPAAVRGPDKPGPKPIAEAETEARRPGAARSEGRRSPTPHEAPLRFTCSLCPDDADYLPRDLAGHSAERHGGSPPLFGCRTCAFSTREISYLRVHQLGHDDTFSCCTLCRDGVRRTWPELSAHLTACHFQNGRYSCQTCPEFSTGDVGLFLEHTYVHSSPLEGAEERRFLPKGAPGRDPNGDNHVCSGGGVEAEGVGPALLDAKRPLVRPRLTRSTVREMCWLAQDCLALPGREFLDKYCHLSDPQTTLRRTREFLMKSVVGERADAGWTKALRSVWSNVPAEVRLHPRSEKGAGSNSSDLAVLTVENKITVAQNGAAYRKKVKAMTSAEKGAGRGAGAPKGCPAGPGASGKAPQRRGGEIQTSCRPAAPGKGPKNRKRGQSVRRKRRAGQGPLKMVLKKNPAKEQQWVSQDRRGASDCPPGPAGLRAVPEEADTGAPSMQPDGSSHRGGNVDLLTSGNQRSPPAEGGTAGTSPASADTLQGRKNGGGLGAADSPEKAEGRTRHGEAATANEVQSQVAGHGPVPKSVERSLTLVAISPHQPVRRPAGNQPVVVLNHPDADLPEVARIMAVIRRYQGAVRKVALSRRTLDALEVPDGPPRPGPGGVQERFLLKLRLRRLNGKKYRVVDGAAPSGGPAAGFGCWFCGRVFVSQETWVAHRRRHLVDRK